MILTEPQSHLEIDRQIESMVRGHETYIRRLALSILDDPAEAEDAAQETFIAAAFALEGFRGQSTMRTWLTSIAINTCRGRLRRLKAQRALLNVLAPLHVLRSRAATVEETAVQNEADRQLWRAVDRLDEKHRLPVLLRYVHEMSVPEIAEALGVREGTVHSRLHYAREKLQAWLESHPVREGGIR